jgi:acyl-CoA reductase-like NAD-dependent aldehyde dehydrogenase
MNDASARIARVRRALAAAARIADASDPLGIEARDRLRATSGLSPAGVELALAEHLETSATIDELEPFVSRACPSTRCAVILSAHVCIAPLRALAFALATAPEVWVKPSRRDPVIAELLARQLAGVELCHDLEEALAPLAAGDELHAYGSDEAMTAIAAACNDAVVLRRHGTGFGVAVVGAEDDLTAAAEALAGDVVPFDGRGCLSPRIVLYEGDPGRAHELADRVHRALLAAAESVPRGVLPAADQAELTQYRHTMQAIGSVMESPDHLLALDTAPESPPPLPPPHRALLLLPASRALPLLEPMFRYVTCIGRSPGSSMMLPAACPRARCVRLGTMQRPPFDGPVDLRSFR